VPSQWVVSPMEFVPTLHDSVKKVTEEVAIEIFAGVIHRTPYFTGNLRASWRIREGSEDLSTTTTGSALVPIGPPSIPKTLGKLPRYPTVYITNAIPYADVVENGSPKNPAAYMVKLTLESLRNT